MKKVFLFVLITIFTVNVFAQNQTARLDLSRHGVKIEPDKRLMIVLASLEAAGLETPLSSQGAEFRAKMLGDLDKLSPGLRSRMRMFIDQYSKRFAESYKQRFESREEQENFSALFERYRRGALSEDERQAFLTKYDRFMPALISPFISMAYSLAPVPDLAEPSRSLDLPDDLLEVLDYAPLVREFYRTSGMRENLDAYVKDYQAEGDRLRPSAVQMVGDLLDYLHTRPQTTYIEKVKTETQASKNKKKTLTNTELRERERRFYIVPEMFAPRGTVNFRNISDDYFAIVPPATDLSSSETRRAFLQFVVDPLVLTNAKDIAAQTAGIKALLEERRRENPNISPDVFLAVSRSLIAAIDAKEAEYRKTQIATAQARRTIDATVGEEEKRKVSAGLEAFKNGLKDETALQLSEAYRNGAVLSFYFARQLDGLAEAGFDIAGSMRDIILSLDAAKETNRLTEFAEAAARAGKTRELRRNSADSSAPIIAENPVTKRLLGIDEIIKAGKYTEADNRLKQLLNEVPGEASRIYYTRGRVASLSAESAADADERVKLLQEAQVFYSNVIRSATNRTDPALLSLTYVALGRIHEFFGESEYAVKIYEAAIKIGNVGDSYKQATAARERLLKEQ